MGFRLWVLEFRVLRLWGLGSRVPGFGVKAWGFRILGCWSLGFRLWVLEFRVLDLSGLGSRVLGLWGLESRA